MKTRWRSFAALVLAAAMLCGASCIGSTQEGTATASSTAESCGEDQTSVEAETVDTTTAPVDPVVVPLNKSYQFTPAGMPGDRSKELLFNPGRGFRYEMAVTSVQDMEAFPSQLQALMRIYAVESPRIVQLYIYLTDYRNKDLDSRVIDAMKGMFAYCQSKKIQVLPRFAYIQIAGANAEQDAEIEQMLRHIRQFAPVLEEYRNVIFALDAGMVMQWGEWAGGTKTYTKYKPVLQELIDATPKDLFILVRYAAIKEMFAGDEARYSRLGYHEDYMVGYPHKWNTGGLETSAYYNMFLTNSADVIVQGEMPWGSDRTPVGSGLSVAMYMSKFHFLALSAVHNYREGGGQYAMVRWKEEEVSADILSQNHLSYQKSWFTSSTGGAYTQNMFHYIRDYTGYRIAAEQVTADMTGKDIVAEFVLKNYGFATPHSLYEGRLVVADEQGNVISSGTPWDVLALKPQTAVTVNARLTRPDTVNLYYIGVMITDRAGTPVRLANDALYANGVNLICPLTE